MNSDFTDDFMRTHMPTVDDLRAAAEVLRDYSLMRGGGDEDMLVPMYDWVAIWLEGVADREKPHEDRESMEIAMPGLYVPVYVPENREKPWAVRPTTESSNADMTLSEHETYEEARESAWRRADNKQMAIEDTARKRGSK